MGIMKISSKDIIFLLGAGASAEAGIPTSAMMIERIEALLSEDNQWKGYSNIYNHVKSAIYYSAGLQGRFNDEVNYNIETLVNTLYELERNEEHPLFPFIATWDQRFVNLARPDFPNVKNFRLLILEELKKWMCPEDTSMSDYYSGFRRLQRDLNFTLHIFSLNYDLCVERLHEDGFHVETGFQKIGPQNSWDWKRFGEVFHDDPPEIVLHKLHGSINWKRDESTNHLFSIEQVQNIDSSKMELIFGRDFKLEAGDPFLFYAYEFRQHTLEASLIITIGYGFGDTHINKMLTQGLRSNSRINLLAVCNCEKDKQHEKREEIGKALELKEREKSQVEVYAGSARSFLSMDYMYQFLADGLPNESNVPF